MVSNKRLVFHMVGDTGSVRNPSLQQLVAEAMTAQCDAAADADDAPRFLYHLGDLVYHHGEADRYYDQFFKPFRNYPGPIFAIAGNHDSDVNPASTVPYQSLDAFKTVFCDTEPRPVALGKDASRNSMIQPNIYWTLDTALATIIGLHSNIPKYGIITDEQRAWFVEELRNAALNNPDKMLILCVHHAPYSADTNHGASLYMINFLESVFDETGIRPDIVFSGHVHNYQRFVKSYPDGKTLPFIVAGAGGFDEIHSIALVDDARFTNAHPAFDDVKLISYFDSGHGFLKTTINKTENDLTLTIDYYSVNTDGSTVLIDSFTVHKAAVALQH